MLIKFELPPKQSGCSERTHRVQPSVRQSAHERIPACGQPEASLEGLRLGLNGRKQPGYLNVRFRATPIGFETYKCGSLRPHPSLPNDRRPALRGGSRP